MAVTKKAILEELGKTPLYNPATDSWLLDEFMFSYNLLKKVKKEIINEKTIVVDVSKDPKKRVYQLSAAFAGRKRLIDEMLSFARQLPLSPRTRKELADELGAGASATADDKEFDENK